MRSRGHMDQRVCIIILNYQGWEDTLECLESVYQINYPHYDIILVDNASPDESITRIRQFCEEGLKNGPIPLREYQVKDHHVEIPEKISDGLFLLNCDKNYGFAEGNNIGISFALEHLKPDYLLFLNNDTVVDPAFLDLLVDQGDKNPKIGLLGPTVYDYNHPRRISVYGGYINLYTGVTSYPHRDEVETGQIPLLSELDYISGCCLLIKKGVLAEIGLFNPAYFLYYEDTELCFRAWRKGYQVVHVGKARVWHKVSPLSISPTGIFYLTRNRFWFLREYSNYPQFIFFLVFFFAVLFSFHTLRYLIRGDVSSIRSFYSGIEEGLSQSTNSW